MITSIPRLQSALKFFLNWISYVLISEITGEICLFRYFGPEREYVKCVRVRTEHFLLNYYIFTFTIQLIIFVYCVCIFLMVQQPLEGQGPLIIEASRSHSDTPHSLGLLWTSDQPDAKTSTWQHTTLTRDRHPCHQRDSNPYSNLILLEFILFKSGEGYKLWKPNHWERSTYFRVTLYASVRPSFISPHYMLKLFSPRWQTSILQLIVWD
jgi:hypothetical protein